MHCDTPPVGVFYDKIEWKFTNTPLTETYQQVIHQITNAGEYGVVEL